VEYLFLWRKIMMRFGVGLMALTMTVLAAHNGYSMAETEPVVSVDAQSGCWEFEGEARYVVVPVKRPGTRVFVLKGGVPPTLTFNGPSQAMIPFRESGTGDWVRTGMLMETGAYTLTAGNEKTLAVVDMTMAVCLLTRDVL
jgi:hypothetical protein